MTTTPDALESPRSPDPDGPSTARPRVVYRTATTLNGLIAGPGDSLAWLFAVASTAEPDHQEFLDGVGAIVMGATTYAWILRETDVLSDAELWREYHGERPVFVFTHGTPPVPDGADVRIVAGAVGDAFAAVAAAADGRAVWVVGGGELAGQFDDAALLDEIQITVAPASLAAGAPLLPRDLGPDRLHLHDVTRFDRFVHLTYRVTPAPRLP